MHELNNLGPRIIRQALGLPDQDTTTNFQKSTSQIKMNFILEAEMVAYSDSLNKIDGAIRCERSLQGVLD